MADYVAFKRFLACHPHSKIMPLITLSKQHFIINSFAPMRQRVNSYVERPKGVAKMSWYMC